jgi:hypothetical protein
MSGQFDPYAYAASQQPQQPQAFDPYAYAASAPSNPNYVPPSVGGGNTWADVIRGAPQAVIGGIDKFGLDILGAPGDLAANIENLGRSGIEAAYLAAGKLPPTSLDPQNPAKLPLTSEWLKKEVTQHFGPGLDVTTDPQSYTLQALNAGAENLGPEAALAPIPYAGDVMRGLAGIEDEPVAGSQMTRSPQSISAAAASPDLSSASPALREAVWRATENGEPITRAVLDRHVQAESLPVPARLTKGQATQDPVLISQEQNQRGLSSGLFAKHFDQQNQNLIENLRAIRDQVGPDVHTTNQTEHGEALINAYLEKDKAANADISAKYQALKDANGGQFPIDARALQTNVTQALHQQLLYEHAPSPEMAQLQRAAEKGMTFEQYEAMRTNLARIMRSSSDGNERAAAGIIRQQMENLPLSPGAQNLKGLADAARQAAKARFDALSADPAYKAAVNGTVPPDRFVSRFVVGGNRDDLALMRQNLAHDPVAQQTISTSALEHLRKSARIDDDFRGNFAAQSYNNALQAFGPKMRVLFPPKQIEDLTNLGDVARYETFQPRGSFVNNSNTAVQQAVEHGKSLAEGAVNAKTFGVGGTLARKVLKGRAERAFAREHLAPGAGITWQPSGATP